MPKFMSKYPWNENNIMFNFTDCADKCLCSPWRFPITGSDNLRHESLYVHQLYIALLVCGPLALYGCTHVRLHVVFYSFCIQFYEAFINVYPGWYFQWLHLQCASALNGVCIAATAQLVAHWIKHLLFSSILIHLHLDEVFVAPCHAVVENVKKMIMKRSRKSWGIHSQL